MGRGRKTLQRNRDGEGCEDLMEKQGEGWVGKSAVRGIRMGQSVEQMIVTELRSESCHSCLE